MKDEHEISNVRKHSSNLETRPDQTQPNQDATLPSWKPT